MYKLFQWLRRHGGRKVRQLAAGELHEVEELVGGQESFRQFWHDSRRLLYDFFIPHHGNDHRPHALRPRSLLVYLLLAVGMKALLSTTLFLYYPTPARLARIIARDLVTLANRSRVEAGLPPLAVDPTLEEAARRKGEDMMVRDYFAHDSPDGRRPWAWIDRQRYDFVYAGENLAIDFLTADSIHAAFLKSPSHRLNILHNRFENIGVAVVSGELGGRETELLVQFFGTKRKVVPPALVAVRPPARPALSPSPGGRATPAPPPATSPGLTLPAASPPLGLAEPPREGAAGRAADGELPSPELLPPGPGEPILVLGVTSKADEVVEALLSFSNFFLLAMAIFLTVALLLNVFIRIKVQHPDLIIQSIAVLSLIAAMLLTKWHFVERLGRQLRILGS